MSITSDLEQILSARYGKDVRQAIHDSIEEGYNIAVQAQGIAETSQESAEAYAQAALASERAAEDYKTAAEQAAEQAMSGTPEGYADLVAKVNSIYRQTATSYNVVGTSEGSVLAHTIYGMSVQDGTPTPDSPVEIQSAKADFRCVGKNLIPYPYRQERTSGNPILINGVTWTSNADRTMSAVGTASGNNSNYYLTDWRDGYPLFRAGETYTLSGCPSGGDTNTYCLIFYGFLPNQSGSELTPNFHRFDTGNGVTFTIPQDCYGRIYCRVANGTTAPTNSFKPMLTLVGVDQTYEPYQHTDVTTDLTLRAIEVTSSDDYNLERDGKYYVADTIDWSEDKGYQITRRINEVTIDENNTSDWYEASTAIYDQITYSLDTITSNIALMCNQMPNAVSWTPNNCFVRSSNHLAHFLFDANKFGSKENAINYFTNNPLIFTYAKDTPTTELITSEQAQALLSLKTYDEATSISAIGDIEPSLDLEYSKDRSTALALTGHNLAHKNALKLNDINTALIELGGN